MLSTDLSIAAKLELLLEITTHISRSQDLDELLTMVLDTLSLLVHYDAAGIYVLQFPDAVAGDRREEARFLRRKALRGYGADAPADIRLGTREGLLGHVVESGRPLVSADVANDPRYISLRDATRSEMAAPIVSNDEVIGVFDLESDEPNRYTDEDLRVLSLLAAQVAIIIEKVMLIEQRVEKTRLEGQLGVARQVQLFLMPDPGPRLERFDIAAYNYSTEEVSGDYYDFASDYDDQLKFAIADVSGKGIPAGLLMAFLRGSLRSAMQSGFATNAALMRMNKLLFDSTQSNQFVTAVYGVLDSTSRTLAFSNAGHNPPLLLSGDGEAVFLEESGVPLGLFGDARYREYFLRMEPGHCLVLYTDGVTEASDGSGEEYGQETLARVALAGRHLPARDLIAYIYADILRHTRGSRPTDDVTFVVIRALAEDRSEVGK